MALPHNSTGHPLPASGSVGRLAERRDPDPAAKPRVALQFLEVFVHDREFASSHNPAGSTSLEYLNQFDFKFECFSSKRVI